MTLQETETKLSELNNCIAELLKERESVLKEWNIAFNTENQDNITCEAKGKFSTCELYLVNGDSKMPVCLLHGDDMECSINDLYKRIDISMHLLNGANGRDYEIPELHRNLVYAKAIEIRERMREILKPF